MPTPTTPPEDTDPLFLALARAAVARRDQLRRKPFDDARAADRRLAEALAEVHRHALAGCWGEDDVVAVAMGEGHRCA